MNIRSARRADAAQVAALLDQLGYPEQDAEATAERIDAWAADPDSAAFVAENTDGLTGVIAVHICPYFERSGAWARIVALVVSESARGAGIGSQLMDAAEDFARTHGCVRMELTSSYRRSAAHEFYRSLGYRDQAGASALIRRDLPGVDGH